MPTLENTKFADGISNLNISLKAKISLTKFKQNWEQEINKIESSVIDNRGSWCIYNRFELDSIIVKGNMWRTDLTWDVLLEMELLESKLTRALETARTRYSLQNKSLWVKLTEGIAGIIRGVPKLN